jgi:hypothetical protein
MSPYAAVSPRRNSKAGFSRGQFCLDALGHHDLRQVVVQPLSIVRSSNSEALRMPRLPPFELWAIFTNSKEL